MIPVHKTGVVLPCLSTKVVFVGHVYLFYYDRNISYILKDFREG